MLGESSQTSLNTKQKKGFLYGPLVILFPVFIYFCAFEMLEAIDPKLITLLISKYSSDPGSTFDEAKRPLVATSKYEIKFEQVITVAALFVVGIYGEVSDRYGRKVILLAHIFVSILAHIIFVIVAYIGPHIRYLYFGAVFLGLSGSIYTYLFAVFSYTADLTTFSQKGYYFGLLEAVCFAGHVIGPFLGGVLYDLVNRQFPYLISVLLLLTTFIYYALFVSESLLVTNRRSFSQKNANPFAAVSVLLFNRLNYTIFTIIFCLGFTSMTLSIALILYTSQIFNWTAEDTGEFLSILQFFRAVAVLILVPLILKYVENLNKAIITLENKFQGPMIIIRVSLFSCTLACVMFAFSRSSQHFYLIAAIFAIGSMHMVGVRTIFCNAVSPRQHGLILSAIGSIEIILRAVDTLFYNYIYSATYSSMPSAFFVFAAGCSFLGLVLSFTLKERDFIHVDKSFLNSNGFKTEIKPLGALNINRRIGKLTSEKVKLISKDENDSIDSSITSISKDDDENSIEKNQNVKL